MRVLPIPDASLLPPGAHQGLGGASSARGFAPPGPTSPEVAAERPRCPAEVLGDHVALRAAGAVEDDIALNYDPDVVMLADDGPHHGWDGVRLLAARLGTELGAAEFGVKSIVVTDRLALMTWDGEGEKGRVSDGVDSFVIENGRIVGQTRRYTVVSR